jgi:ankyrin repeat protein
MEEPFFLGDWFPLDCPEEINKQLIEAIEKNNFNLVLELLSKGANPNVDIEEGSALFVAIHKGEPKIVQALLDNGANPNLEDEDQHTVLMSAAYAGHLEIVKALLNSGANIHAMGKGSTALSMAVWAEQGEIVEHLWPLVSDEERQYANCWRKDVLGTEM